MEKSSLPLYALAETSLNNFELGGIEFYLLHLVENKTNGIFHKINIFLLAIDPQMAVYPLSKIEIVKSNEVKIVLIISCKIINQFKISLFYHSNSDL